MTREERANEMWQRAMKLINARGGTRRQLGTREYTKAGLKIQQSRISDTCRLIVTTAMGKVMLSVEWESSGRIRVLSYTPGFGKHSLNISHEGRYDRGGTRIKDDLALSVVRWNLRTRDQPS